MAAEPTAALPQAPPLFAVCGGHQKWSPDGRLEKAPGSSGRPWGVVMLDTLAPSPGTVQTELWPRHPGFKSLLR